MLTIIATKFAPEINGITLILELFFIFSFFKGWFEPEVYKTCWNITNKLERWLTQ